MKSLFLDTTGQKMRITYVVDGTVVRDFVGNDGISQSSEIFGAMENVLGNVGIGDLDFMVVLGGPGSFTGIRLGLSVAKGFYLATKIPVVVINNFRAMFYSLDETTVAEIMAVAGNKREFHIAISAGVNDVYVAKYDMLGAEVVAGRIIKRAEFVADLPVVEDVDVVPDMIVRAVEKSLLSDVDDGANWRKHFMQGAIEPTYIKPHYAKVKGEK